MINKLQVQSLECYIIVVKDNPTSEFYYEMVLPMWHQIGIFPKRFDAITPKTLPNHPLKFHKNYAAKYAFMKGKQFTETEKSCFYSHFLLWQRCVETGQKILILEHDTVPFNPNLLFYFEPVWFKSFDKGAMGCYVMDPFFAKLSINRVLNQGVCSGPLGELQHFFCGNHGTGEQSPIVKEGKLFYMNSSKNYVPACTQIYHPKYSTTISHEIPGLKTETKLWPNYIIIDDSISKLTLEFVQNAAAQMDYGHLSLSTIIE